jgi:hypothetical protein
MIKEVNTFQDVNIKSHFLVEVCAKSSHAENLGLADYDLDLVRPLGGMGTTVLLSIKINDEALLRNVERGPVYSKS